MGEGSSPLFGASLVLVGDVVVDGDADGVVEGARKASSVLTADGLSSILASDAVVEAVMSIRGSVASIGAGLQSPSSVALGIAMDGDRELLEMVEYGDDGEHSSANSLPDLADDVIGDGLVREEVRVSPTTRVALRPQTTDGLWQPTSSLVEPGVERAEKPWAWRGWGAALGLAKAGSVSNDVVGAQSSSDSLADEQEVNVGDGSAAMLNPTVTVSSSYISLSVSASAIIGDELVVEGWMVSEEGLASLEAGEALRPSPTDGWRQPPLSPVEPAMETGRGGLVPGCPAQPWVPSWPAPPFQPEMTENAPKGSVSNDVVGAQLNSDSLANEQEVNVGDGSAAMLNPTVTVSSSYVTLSVSASAIIGDELVVEGGMVSEEGLASLAAGEGLRPSPTDGWREPPLSPVEPAMGTGRGGSVPGAGGGLLSGGGGLDTAGRVGGDGGVDPCHLSRFEEGVLMVDLEQSEDWRPELCSSPVGLTSPTAVVPPPPLAVDGFLKMGEGSSPLFGASQVLVGDVVLDGDADGVVEGARKAGSMLTSDDLSSILASDVVVEAMMSIRGSITSIGAGLQSPSSVALGTTMDGNRELLEMVEYGDDGEQLRAAVGGWISGVSPDPGSAARLSPIAMVSSCANSLPDIADDVIGDGLVREEVRVSPTTRVALRPQPTDGLWQPTSSLVEPGAEWEEKVVLGGVSIAQACHGGVQSSRTAIIGDELVVEGGMTSEEGLASPTDGRRQPPLSLVEPTMETGRGGLVVGAVGGLLSGGGGLDTADRVGGDGGG
ncbi:hypothetical protein Dimus_030425, partial [Dionaea muscipula]